MIDHDLPAPLRSFLAEGGYGGITACEILHGGTISQTRRLTTAKGGTVIAKFSEHIPDDFYTVEADGLDRLRHAGMRVPAVIEASSDFIVMEDLGSQPAEEIDWPAFGRTMAGLHSNHNEQFGFAYDNYIGRLRQTNMRTTNGHEFFAEHRIRAYLSRPLCELACTAEDRSAIEKLADKLPDIIPVQPASLLHGDLWSGNILPLGDGRAGLIDPAVHFGWAEADLTPAWLHGGVPPSFFDAYCEVNPLEPGYMERFPLLAVREWLAMIAQFGPHPVLMNIRAVVARFH